MPIPPSIRGLLPSLSIVDDKEAIIELADLKALLPSLGLVIRGKDTAVDGTLRMSLDDLRKILRVALASVDIEESWYFSRVPELRADIRRGKFTSAFEHYYTHGYLEGRLPEEPKVDEPFYLRENRDVAKAVAEGKFKNALEHFVQDGYAEGRRPTLADTQVRRR
jgi:hypothetical protein